VNLNTPKTKSLATMKIQRWGKEEGKRAQKRLEKKEVKEETVRQNGAEPKTVLPRRGEERDNRGKHEENEEWYEKAKGNGE